MGIVYNDIKPIYDSGFVTSGFLEGVDVLYKEGYNLVTARNFAELSMIYYGVLERGSYIQEGVTCGRIYGDEKTYFFDVKRPSSLLQKLEKEDEQRVLQLDFADIKRANNKSLKCSYDSVLIPTTKFDCNALTKFLFGEDLAESYGGFLFKQGISSLVLDFRSLSIFSNREAIEGQLYFSEWGKGMDVLYLFATNDLKTLRHLRGIRKNFNSSFFNETHSASLENIFS